MDLSTLASYPAEFTNPRQEQAKKIADALATLTTSLQTMTRRPVEAVNATTVRGHFTDFRYLELSIEADSSTSAWSVASMIIAGKPVKFALLIGRLNSADKLRQVMRRAKDMIQEVINGGSQVATLMSEAVTNGGTRMFVYHDAGLDAGFAARMLASFAERNKLTVEGEADKTPAAKVAKNKRLSVGRPAASD